MTDNRQARPPAESRMALEGQQNAGGMRRLDGEGRPYYDAAPLSEYPRMMYRATGVEKTQEHADVIAGLKDPPMVINRFDGLLCDTVTATDADEAETLASDGWDLSPRAAHGIADGLVKATSAKDDEIAALRAELARRDAGGEEPPRRGPGRPPKPQDLPQ